MKRRKPPASVRRRQRRTARAKAFADSQRLDWLENTCGSIQLMRQRYISHNETVRQAIDHFLQQAHYQQRDGIAMEAVDGNLRPLARDGNTSQDGIR